MYLPARSMNYFIAQRGLDRRARLYLRQKGECYWCGRFMKLGPTWRLPDSVTEDHLLARAYGGQTSMENLVASCFRCNNLRQELSETFYRHILKLYGKHLPELGSVGYAALQRSIRHYLDGRHVRVRVPSQSSAFVCDAVSAPEMPRALSDGSDSVDSPTPVSEEKI